jgi:hypothetical protein
MIAYCSRSSVGGSEYVPIRRSPTISQQISSSVVLINMKKRFFMFYLPVELAVPKRAAFFYAVTV